MVYDVLFNYYFTWNFISIFNDAISNNKISVGPPFYNSVIIPVVIVFLVFMAIGPQTKWIKNKFSNVKTFLIMVCGAVILNFIIIYYFKSCNEISNL